MQFKQLKVVLKKLFEPMTFTFPVQGAQEVHCISPRLPPLWPRVDFCTSYFIWVEFVAGSYFVLRLIKFNLHVEHLNHKPLAQDTGQPLTPLDKLPLPLSTS